MAHAGSTKAPLGFGEASGYQTDGDSGLRLLGHRHYDSRTGRFISQDLAADGDNWYAYCDNDPVSGRDPGREHLNFLGTLVRFLPSNEAEWPVK